MARTGVLSDEAIKRACPEMFSVDFRTHQAIYADSTDIPKHRLSGIRRPKTPFQDIKTKPRFPMYDLYHVAQAIEPSHPGVNSAVGLYRRAVSDQEGPKREVPNAPAAFQVARGTSIRSGGRQAYVGRFDDQYGDILTVARVDPRAKIFIELAGLNPYEYIPPMRTTSRVHITAGGIRNELLQKVHSFSREQLQTIEGSYRLSEEIAHQGIATATPSFSQRLQSFGYSFLSPDTTPTRGLFDRE